MDKIIIWTLILGVLLLLFSVLNIKSGRKKQYKLSKITKYKNKILNSKLLGILSNNELRINKKLRARVKLIKQCEISYKLTYNKTKFRGTPERSIDTSLEDRSIDKSIRKIYLIKLLIFILVFISCILTKIYLNTYLVEQQLNENTIYSETQYRVSKSDAIIFNEYLRDKYMEYFDEEKFEEFYTLLVDFNNTTCKIDEEDLKILANQYVAAYRLEQISLKQYLIMGLISFISIFSVNVVVIIRASIFKLKLLEEFHNLELIALIHMTRDGVNIYELLLELNRNSVYLKPYLIKCLNTYPTNQILALDNLAKEIDNEGFYKFIDILKSCLVISKDINYEVLKIQRRLELVNDRIDLEKKLEYKLLYLTIGKIPISGIIIFNFLIPCFENLNIAKLY